MRFQVGRCCRRRAPGEERAKAEVVRIASEASTVCWWHGERVARGVECGESVADAGVEGGFVREMRAVDSAPARGGVLDVHGAPSRARVTSRRTPFPM